MHAYTTHKYDTNLIVGIVHHIVAFPGAYINSPDKICSCPYDNTKSTVLLYKGRDFRAMVCQDATAME